MIGISNITTTERLIQEVRARPPLWDQRNINYHNRVVVNALWQDIADSLQINKENVKVKWKGLRDTYRRELKKQRSMLMNSGGNGDNARDPSWAHYSSMNFLREYMGSSNNQSEMFHFQGWTTDETTAEEVSPTEEAFNSFMSSTNLMDMEVPKENASDTADTDEESANAAAIAAAAAIPAKEEPNSASSPPHEGSTNSLGASAEDHPAKTSTLNRREKPVAKGVGNPVKERRIRSKLLRKSTKLLNHVRGAVAPQHDDSDDDLYFFKSLIPYVKTLPPTRKLCLRAEIHNLVLREIMSDCNSTPTVIPLEHVSVGMNG